MSSLSVVWCLSVMWCLSVVLGDVVSQVLLVCCGLMFSKSRSLVVNVLPYVRPIAVITSYSVNSPLYSQQDMQCLIQCASCRACSYLVQFVIFLILKHSQFLQFPHCVQYCVQCRTVSEPLPHAHGKVQRVVDITTFYQMKDEQKYCLIATITRKMLVAPVPFK